ncbi:TniQ family protein [Azospirillum baldaniorum]|uniref:TniQ family protein n=1 Tax=Azospirillum baldaniorum TaxID=1064539 RepID=UPI001FFFEA3F|nr:TniQ family protein [Azospirillum baldaniorum]
MRPEPADRFPVEPLERGRPKADRWAAEPAPLDGELLSSWLNRYAWANAMGPDAFLRGLRPVLGRNVTDPDSAVPTRFLDFLTRRTGLPAARLTLLQSGAHAWASLGMEMRPAPYFCPGCWRAEPTPYVRWEWRMTPLHLCSEHGSWLCRRCPHCRAPLSLLQGVSRRHLWECAACRHDLRRAKALPASLVAILGQGLVHDILDQADAIAREGIAKEAFSLLSNLDAGLNALRRTARGETSPAVVRRSGLAAVDGSWRSIHDLLNAIPFGGVRERLLHRLQERVHDPAWAMATPAPSSPRLCLCPSAGAQPPARCVRQATLDDIPALQRFCRTLSAVLDKELWLGKDPEHRDSLRDLLAIRWHSFAEEDQPLAVALDGDAIVGVGMVWAERLIEIFVDPIAEATFLPTLLEGITHLAARRGVRRIEARVDRTHRAAFEVAGWQGSGSFVTSPLWSKSLT